MKLIDSGYDDLVNSNYNLYSIKFNDLKVMVKSWYPGINFREFDERDVEYGRDIPITEVKKSGLISNLFFAYKDGSKHYLLDGFNRILTDYSCIINNPVVYIKILVDDLMDHELMKIMFYLNVWKLYQSKSSYGGYGINDFFDRGMKLFLYTKYNIEFYTEQKRVYRDNPNYKRDYDNRLYDVNDISVLQYYFRNETKYSGDFTFEYDDVSKIFSNTNIINDIKDIIKSNKYKERPFKNYGMFLQGYCMFLGWRRSKLDDNSYEFETYLNLLIGDKKFFKKLKNMSGTDSTRINIYHFFRNLVN